MVQPGCSAGAPIAHRLQAAARSVCIQCQCCAHWRWWRRCGGLWPAWLWTASWWPGITPAVEEFSHSLTSTQRQQLEAVIPWDKLSYIFAADGVGFLWWTPKAGSFVAQSAVQPFKVIRASEVVHYGSSRRRLMGHTVSPRLDHQIHIS